MRRHLRALVAALAVCAALAGCGHAPQSAEEFRKEAPGAFLMKKETMEVARPFRDVAETFRKKAPECLRVAVRTTSSTSTSYQVIDAEYKPTVVITKDRAELHLQRRYTKGVVNAYAEPEGGHYILVADASPLAGNKTRVDLIAPSRGLDAVVRAVKGWATGENVGCPDMTKN
jgi:hypothetical protein